MRGCVSRISGEVERSFVDFSPIAIVKTLMLPTVNHSLFTLIIMLQTRLLNNLFTKYIPISSSVFAPYKWIIEHL